MANEINLIELFTVERVRGFFFHFDVSENGQLNSVWQKSSDKIKIKYIEKNFN